MRTSSVHRITCTRSLFVCVLSMFACCGWICFCLYTFVRLLCICTQGLARVYRDERAAIRYVDVETWGRGCMDQQLLIKLNCFCWVDAGRVYKVYACLPLPTTCRGTRAFVDRLSATPRGPLLWCTWRCCVPRSIARVFRRCIDAHAASTHASPREPLYGHSIAATLSRTCPRLFDALAASHHIRADVFIFA